MRLFHAFLLLFFASGMGVGQLLFKLTAERHGAVLRSHGLAQGLFAMMADWLFWLAIFLYAGLTFYWVWLLTFLPLSRAYPATLFSLVVVSSCSFFILHEPVSSRLIAGLILICLGIYCVASG